MKHLLVLACVLLGSLNVFADGANGNNLSGKVISIDPISIYQFHDKKFTTVQIEPDNFSLWKSTISFHGAHTGGCGCNATSVGFSQSPVSVLVEKEGKKYLLTIPAHRTVLFADRNRYQIDVKGDEFGPIVIDEDGSTTNKDKVIEQFKGQRATTAKLLKKMTKEVSHKHYEKARKTYSEILLTDIYGDEEGQLGKIYESIPLENRPINTFTNDVRWEMRTMIKTFQGTQFDEMTLSQFIQFVDEWASKPFGRPRVPGEPNGDQTYLFRFFDQVGIPDSTQFALYTKAIDVRLKFLIEVANKSDAKSHKRTDTFNDEYNAEVAIKMLKYGKIENGRAYLDQLKERLAGEPKNVIDFLSGTLFGYELFRNRY